MTYTIKPGAEPITLSCDFSTFEFDWDNMLDSYQGSYSEAEADAVARLSYAGGVALEMEYWTYASSAYSQLVPRALIDFFGYDKRTVCLIRDVFTADEWEQTVYDQLVDYGPAAYSGANNEAGHSFVCDGYGGDDYFHFNWGWSGISDGYYLLTALNPPAQGIGGSSGAFSYGQDIIANVRQAQPDSHYILNLIMTDSFVFSDESVPVGSTVTIHSTNIEDFLWNYCAYTFTGSCGIRITPCDDTPGETVYAGTPLPTGLGILKYVSSYECTIPANLPDGTYRVTPAAKDPDGDWQDIHVLNNYVKEQIMTVTDGAASALSSR